MERLVPSQLRRSVAETCLLALHGMQGKKWAALRGVVAMRKYTGLPANLSASHTPESVIKSDNPEDLIESNF